VLAGCLVTDGAPDRQCTRCGHGFGVAHGTTGKAAERR
jgi:hypothetical protein